MQYFKGTKILRDGNGWYHIVLAVDTTQASANDRVKIYINGEQETAATYNAPTQNADLVINANGATHQIGNYSTNKFDGYLAEVHFVDGQQLAPTDFGYTEFQTNVWRPKRYQGTWGTNGFYLDFRDSSSAAALGHDRSGNGNNFTPNAFSVTADHDGVNTDSVTDQDHVLFLENSYMARVWDFVANGDWRNWRLRDHPDPDRWNTQWSESQQCTAIDWVHQPQLDWAGYARLCGKFDLEPTDAVRQLHTKYHQCRRQQLAQYKQWCDSEWDSVNTQTSEWYKLYDL